MQSTSDIQSLQKRIHDLTDLYSSVQHLRQIPATLLKSPVSNGISFMGLGAEFQQLKDVAENIRSDTIQEALQSAHVSLHSDTTETNSNARRENRKRRRPASPASPQPYIATTPCEPCAFPSIGSVTPLGAEELLSFAKEHNQGSKNKLHIWRRTMDEPKSEHPTLLRFLIPDVMTVYITVGYLGPNGTIVVENLSAFSPRERKAPHLQSDYTVHQNLSQQFSRVLHLHPNISFQSVMSLLGAYDNLFVDRCIGCGRVLSTEGHVPPVVRMWNESNKEENGHWEARHITCRQDQ